MPRELTEDDREDYRVQALEELRERIADHPYDPTCGCGLCEDERGSFVANRVRRDEL